MLLRRNNLMSLCLEISMPVRSLVALAFFSAFSPTALAQDPVSTRHTLGLELIAATPFHGDLAVAQDAPGRKSVGLAVIYSLLVPGMGELYAGGFGSGKYFLGAEGLLWLTYAAFDIRAGALRNDSRSFASVHAGASPSGKNDQFFVDVGNFMTLADYNDKKLRDRDELKVYDPALGYAWSWDTNASRSAYRDMRVRSEEVYNNRRFVVAAILINHMASAINAARAAISHNKDVGPLLGDVSFEAHVLGGFDHPQGIQITFNKPL